MRESFRRFLTVACLVATSASSATTTEPPKELGSAEKAFASSLAHESSLSEQAILDELGRAHVQQSVLDAIARPAEAKPWKDYRPIFLTDRRVQEGVAFYREHRALLDKVGKDFGVPPEVVTAILGVETHYGKVTGRYRVIDSLVTLAFHYPPREAFFRDELRQLFLLHDAHLAFPLDELRGSYAGAMGWGQFMPSSIAKYARDYDGDGKIDLWNSLPDIAASVANYFKEFGWETGGPVTGRAQPAEGAREIHPANLEPVYPLEQLVAWGYAPIERFDPAMPASLLTLEGPNGPEYWLTFRNFYVISRYNKSPLYSMAVWQLAQEIARQVDREAGP